MRSDGRAQNGGESALPGKLFVPIFWSMHPANTIQTSVLVGAALAAVCLSGCASAPPPEPDPTRSDDARAPAAFRDVTYSGYLGDYSRLVTSPRHPGTLYEQSARLSGYGSFIVEPFTFLPERTVRGERISDGDASELARALRDETVAALSLLHPVVEKPGPGVATIRAAITALAGSRVDPSSGQVQIGGAAVEIEIVDSLTRERLAAAIESDVVRDSSQPIAGDPFSDARLVFRHWAARLNLWLRDSAELATRP